MVKKGLNPKLWFQLSLRQVFTFLLYIKLKIPYRFAYKIYFCHTIFYSLQPLNFN